MPSASRMGAYLVIELNFPTVVGIAGVFPAVARGCHPTASAKEYPAQPVRRLTRLMVTDDQDMFPYAGRQVLLRDGLPPGDTRTPSACLRHVAAEP